MRLSAYALLGDPAYLAASIASYYDLVDSIHLSFDRDRLSWGGAPLPIEECLREAATVDPLGKIRLVEGRFAAPGTPPLESETRQRQVSVDAAAASGADWVLQLDTDEVMTDPATFQGALAAAHSRGAAGLDYPSRWLYAEPRPGLYLENSGRFWQPASSYPGPLAIRAGSELRHCRQVTGVLHRVDVRNRNTDTWRPKETPVHQVIPLRSAVLHFSWTRTVEEMAGKARISGHSGSPEWERSLARWQRRSRQPWRGAAFTPLRGHGLGEWLRVTRIPVEVLPRHDRTATPVPR